MEATISFKIGELHTLPERQQPIIPCLLMKLFSNSIKTATAYNATAKHYQYVIVIILFLYTRS